MPGHKGLACGLWRSLDVILIPVLTYYRISNLKGNGSQICIFKSVLLCLCYETMTKGKRTVVGRLLGECYKPK